MTVPQLAQLAEGAYSIAFAVEQLAVMLLYFQHKTLSCCNKMPVYMLCMQTTCTADTYTGAWYMPHHFIQHFIIQQDKKTNGIDSKISDTLNKKTNKKVVGGSDSVAKTTFEQAIETSIGDVDDATDGISTQAVKNTKVSHHHVTVQLCNCAFTMHIAMTTAVVLT
jgi:hypothetical protein